MLGMRCAHMPPTANCGFPGWSMLETEVAHQRPQICWKEAPGLPRRIPADSGTSSRARAERAGLLPLELLRWKAQARAVKAVKGKSVIHNIVSAACLKKKEWELLWVDPPADDEALDLDIELITFLEAYYTPIRDLIAAQPSRIESPFGPLAYVESVGAFIGLHQSRTGPSSAG